MTCKGAAMLKVKSPTGCVHAVEGGNKKDRKRATMCNHVNYYRYYGDQYYHDWPFTDDEVTCQKCIAAMVKRGIKEGKTMPKKRQKWLVTVAGYSNGYTPPNTMVSVEIELPEDETPGDWFLTRPKCYHRFKFTPHALINFCKVK